MLKWIVSSQENGMRLQDFLQKKLSSFPCSNREFKRQIELNRCLVNGIAERFASKKLQQSDHVQFDPSMLGEGVSKPLFESARIRFEDESLLIYNKPSGVISDANGLLKLLKPYGDYLLTHRLDKDTTGLIILAKNKSVEMLMMEAFRKREISKVYYALVDGCPRQSQGTIENRLGKIKEFHGQTIYGEVGKEKGLMAKTNWYLRKTFTKAALLECHPETGRTHQIRAHLSEWKHPILGDYQYSQFFRCKIRPRRPLLHAAKISFIHPIEGGEVAIEASLPPDFEEVMKELL